MMRRAGEGAHGDRLRGLIVVMWRAGLRISEALELYERDLEPGRGALPSVRARMAADVRSAWTTGDGTRLRPWVDRRGGLPLGRSSASARPAAGRGRHPPYASS